MQEGDLEIGQVSALIRDIKPAAEVVREVWEEFERVRAAPLEYVKPASRQAVWIPAAQ